MRQTTSTQALLPYVVLTVQGTGLLIVAGLAALVVAAAEQRFAGDVAIELLLTVFPG